MNRDVEQGYEHERNGEGPRHRAVRIAYFAARAQRHLHAGECEDHEDRGAPQAFAVARPLPGEVLRNDKPRRQRDEQDEAGKFRNRGSGRQSGAGALAHDVDGGQHDENADERGRTRDALIQHGRDGAQ